MLTCHACFKRRLQILVGASTVLPSSLSLRIPITTNQNSPIHRRNHTDALVRADSTPSALSNRALNTVSTRSDKRKEWLESRGTRPANKPAKKDVDQDFVVRKHLQYLKDPLKLAEHVRRCLREDDFNNTITLVRAASKDTQCTVSWNHLIEWQLSKGRMNAALRTYNEMKKRAQSPDARTYTIIFNGCSEHPDSAHALAKVMSIYQSMLTERSPIKPNTIHMNAILKMCARAQDMEALFAIADQLPAKGLRAPNNLTYTTIFNALRIYAVNDLRSTLTPMQKRDNRRKALLDGRLLWGDVINRWRQGDMWIDEELVCAMGRLLLVGEAEDWDDILSLLEQATNLPRNVPRLGTRSRERIEPGSQGKVATGIEPGSQEKVATGIEPGSQGKVATGIEPGSQGKVATGGEEVPDSASVASGTGVGNEDTAAPAQLFGKVKLIKRPPPTLIAYAEAGPNTLSLIMQCLLKQRLKEPATKYWTDLTAKRIHPDADNYHAYLRVLRVARASSETVDIVASMPASYRSHKTSRIAMSTCERDTNNRNAFINAGKILDLMQTKGRIPDISTLISYLTVACTSTAYSDKQSSNGESVPSKYARGKQILRALGRLSPSYINIRSLLAYSDPSRPADAPLPCEEEPEAGEMPPYDEDLETDDISPHDKEHDGDEIRLRDPSEVVDDVEPPRGFSRAAAQVLPPHEELRENVLILTRKLITAHDLLIRNNLAPREIHPGLIAQRSKLASYVTRFTHADPSFTKRYIGKPNEVRRMKKENRAATKLAKSRGEIPDTQQRGVTQSGVGKSLGQAF